MPKESPLPAEHIGNIPAGHKRDEEIRRRTDTLEQRAEEESAPFEPINEEKFRQVDNEIAREFTRNTRTGILEKLITHRQAGYVYVWFKNPATCRTTEAEHCAEAMILDFTDRGGELVEGDMPEAPELRGKGKDNLTSRRGYGDVILARMKQEYYEANQRAVKAREQKRGLVEQEVVNEMMARGFVGSADPNHPAFQRSGVMNPGQLQHVQFNQGDLARGSIRGADGRVLEPGFERRQQ